MNALSAPGRKKGTHVLTFILSLMPLVPVFLRVVQVTAAGSVEWGPLAKVGIMGKKRLLPAEEIQAVYDGALVATVGLAAFGFGTFVNLLVAVAGEEEEEDVQNKKKKE
jgi:hypothetical protein